MPDPRADTNAAWLRCTTHSRGTLLLIRASKSKENDSIQMLNRSFSIGLGFFLAFAVWLTQPMLGSSKSPADEHVKLELVSEQNAVVPGKELWLGIRFDLQDGWHTYWTNPGDSGEAPRIEWRLPAGFEAGAIQWPYPERLATPPFADYGYKHQVLLTVPIQSPAELKDGQPQKIAALVRYLICRDVCIPGQKQLELSLPVRSRAAASARALFDAARSRLPRPAPRGWKISATSTGDEFLLNLRIGKLANAPEFFPLNAEQIENAAVQEATTIPGGIVLHLKKSKHLLKPVARLKGVIVLDSARAYLVDVPVSQTPGRIKRN